MTTPVLLTRALRRSRRLLLATAAVAAVTVALPVPPAVADEGGHTVTISPSTGFISGQDSTVTVTGPGGSNVVSVDVQGAVCRPGPVYQGLQDLSGVAGNCPDGTFERLGLRASGDDVKGPWQRQARLEIGVGSAAWATTSTPPVAFSLTCDKDNPCQLVSVITVLRDAAPFTSTHAVTTPLQYADELQAVGCPRRAPGVLSFATPARLGPAASGWNRASCALPNSPGLPTSGAELDELDGIADVASGDRDLAYGGLGLQGDAWFSADPAKPARATVATPVGINAAVVAVGNGYRTAEGTIRPYENVSLTLDELNLLLNTNVDTTAFADLADRPTTVVSPEQRQALTRSFHERNQAAGFGPVPSGAPRWPHNGGNFPVCEAGSLCASGLVLASQADTSTWVTTRAMAARLGSNWRVWDNMSGAPAGTARGTSASIGLAQPPFGQLSVFTGGLAGTRFRQLRNNTLFQRQATAGAAAGPVWVLTDLASARAQGLRPVGIKVTPTSEPVFPTEATMARAAERFKPDDTGVLVPDPGMDPGAGADAAYPLTFVEHALSPAEPLRTDDGGGACTLRTDSQALLKDWLTLVTSPGGQGQLGGLVPLTPGLAQRAAESIDRVGKAPAPANCTPPPAPPGGGDGGGGSLSPDGITTGFGGSSAPGSFGSGSFAGLGGDGGGGAGANMSITADGGGQTPGGPGANDKPGTSPDTTPASDQSLPPFGGGLVASSLVTATALGLMALLATGAARLNSSSRTESDAGEPEGPVVHELVDGER